MAYLTNDMIADVWLNRLEAVTAIMKVATGDWSDQWGSGPTKGRSVRIRLPIKLASRRGSQAVPQIPNENYTQLDIPDAYGCDTVITDAEMAMDLQDFDRQIAKPSAEVVAVDIARAATRAIFEGCPNFVGVPGVVPSTLDLYSDAGRILTQAGCPMIASNRHMLIDAHMDQKAVAAGRGLLNPPASISDQYKKGTMGEYGGAMWSGEQYIARHTVGTYGGTQAPLVNGTMADGASFVTDGWGSGVTTIKKNDRIQFADVFMVDPVSGEQYADLQSFRQTVDVSDTTGAITLTLDPPMVSSGPYKNVSALPANNAPIYVWGLTGTDLVAISGKAMKAGILMESEALIYASPKLDDGEPGMRSVTDKRMKLSMRVWRYADGNSGNRNMRVDLLCGFKVPQWQRGVIICSA